MNINKYELFTKIFIKVLFFSIFIGFFFFTYGSIIGKKIISTQIDIFSDNITNSSKLFGRNLNNLLLQSVNNITIPDTLKNNNKIINSNKSIISNTIKLNIIFFIVSSFIIYYVYKKSNNSFDLGEVISNSLVLLFFIGLTHFLFITFFVSKFISIDSNQTKLSILKALKKYYF